MPYIMVDSQEGGDEIAEEEEPEPGTELGSGGEDEEYQEPVLVSEEEMTYSMVDSQEGVGEGAGDDAQ